MVNSVIAIVPLLGIAMASGKDETSYNTSKKDNHNSCNVEALILVIALVLVVFLIVSFTMMVPMILAAGIIVRMVDSCSGSCVVFLMHCLFLIFLLFFSLVLLLLLMWR